jgi:hypothetical protein
MASVFVLAAFAAAATLAVARLVAVIRDWPLRRLEREAFAAAFTPRRRWDGMIGIMLGQAAAALALAANVAILAGRDSPALPLIAFACIMTEVWLGAAHHANGDHALVNGRRIQAFAGIATDDLDWTRRRSGWLAVRRVRALLAIGAAIALAGAV